MKPKKRRKRTQKRIQKRMKWGILISLVILAVAAVAAGIQGMKKSETETAAGKIESSGRASQQGAGESTESAKILDNTGISNTVEPQESANAEAKQEDGKTPENTGISDQAENFSAGGNNRTGSQGLEKAPEQQAAEILASMTLEDKISQMFFITPEALTGVRTVTSAGTATVSALQEYPVGGLVYFEQNLVSPEQTRKMLAATQEYMIINQKIPIFLGIDEEGGRVLRVGDNANFQVETIKAMGTLAAGKDLQTITNAGNTIGNYLSDLGFNVDFAPDADVLTNPSNQVIGDRSFGADPEEVAEMAWAFSQGLHRNYVLAAYKHFPGHGETKEDSHTGYAFSYKTIEELWEVELIPFQSGCENGVDFIMAGHISLPNVTEDDMPASLSKTLITDLLREEMGYSGIIITDAMNMGAIANHYTSGEGAVAAIQAGCDMVLMPKDFREAHAAVVRAVSQGQISEERIDESVLRILQAKLQWKDSL